MAPDPPSITLRLPSKYAAAAAAAAAAATDDGPPQDWLCGGDDAAATTADAWWSVTHSTLALWRTAQNVRIRYRARPPHSGGRACNEDRVEYETRGGDTTKGGGVHAVSGGNVASFSSVSPSAFDWRGKGWLFFVTSHWEILGWGEAPVHDDGGTTTERWAVTWFAPTLFTKEGLDIYCDRPGGLSAATTAALLRALGAAEDQPATGDAPGLAPLIALVAQLQTVTIQLPWQKA